MCCYQITQLGSVYEKRSLIDIWRSPLAQSIRDTTTKGNLHSVCSSWNVCPFIVQKREPRPIRAYKNCEYPTHLEICLPDFWCNIGGVEPSDKNPACIMCIRNHRKPEQKDITDLICQKALPLMPHLRHLSVLGIAEPFWKDRCFEIFEQLGFAKYKHQIQFETNTNCTLLTPKVIARFLMKFRCLT